MALSICVDQDKRINYRKKDRRRKGYTMIDMSTKLQGEGRHRWQRKAANPKGTVKPLPPQSRVLKAQRRASFPTTKYRIAIAETRR